MIAGSSAKTWALGLAAALAACSGNGGETTNASEAGTARAVTVAHVQLRPMTGTFAASGLLLAREEAAVDSELSGYRVAQVLVDEGDVVRAGQPLARLDDTLLQSRIAQARAQLAQSQAQAAQAQGEAARVRGLDGTGVLADEQIAARRFQAKSAAAAVGVSRASLQDLQTQQSRMMIRSPVDGVILQRNARPGEIAAPGGDPMFRIARNRLIELDAEVPEDGLVSIRPGTTARVTLPSGATLTGSVRFVSPRVDPQTKLGRVRVRLPVHPDLRAGGFARAEFLRPARPVPAVPERAIQFEASGPSVILINQQNRAHRQAIRPGVRSEGWVELVQGPGVGSRVALGGGAFLLEGDLVRPVEEQVNGPAPAATPKAGGG
ncbi:MAG: efflux RND transporter periplasmic adaptor subunit [Sphingomonas sp.]|uniref:efflux RND transporter periplasmic adaptor subunit n=1 Tax=Sphingomonas sp. TaxID=28214 RepID=UPI001B1CDF82|nr:efflux RND transporter periplasmic adaptor subunit [Sphingomonas sp.]MBO9622954.1 efflux RND transporter periplasmic adaptor subunit [Sphingomonas sp.]